MSVRVRFAPSPTGSLHVGNALTAVANRRFADERGGVLVIRVDDTDATRTVEGGEEAILEDLGWLGVAFEEGPVRQSERGGLYADAAERALDSSAAARGRTAPCGSLAARRSSARTGRRPYRSFASVVDDLDLRITHVIRGSDHRPNLDVQQRIARALGGELAEVIHHGLVLGPDEKKLSKRHGHSSIAELRGEGFPRPRSARTSTSSTCRSTTSSSTSPGSGGSRSTRSRRCRTSSPQPRVLRSTRCPRCAAPARSSRRARTHASCSSPAPELPVTSRPTLERFAELRVPAPDRLSRDDARAILRELKAVGGDLRTLGSR